MRWRALGLRTRVMGALLLTTAVSLAVAALALLSPLETRLRRDAASSVLTAVASIRPNFAEDVSVDRTGHPNLAQLRQVARQLRQRAGGATVFVLSRSLTPIVSEPQLDTDLRLPSFPDAAQALATQRSVSSILNGTLLVAEPIQIGHIRYAVALRKRLSYVSPAVRVVRNAFLEAAGAGLLATVLVGFALTTTLLRRLERLRKAARDFEQEGLDAHPPLDRGNDEIGDLARAFASMQSRLRRQEAARRAFVATASHELRTPLASLDGMLELLEDDLNAEHLDLVDARERTLRAKEQSRRLSHLATDLLDLSRLDADVALRVELLELGEIARAVVAELELRARKENVTLELEQPMAAAWVQADPGAVARIFRILLDNALRVAPGGSSVTIELAHGKAWASAAVSDDGPGVAEDERELIFERFQRGSQTGGRSGFGLGLAIGRELATRMGGSLLLESEPSNGTREHCGARFVLHLPIAELPSAVVEAADQAGAVL